MTRPPRGHQGPATPTEPQERLALHRHCHCCRQVRKRGVQPAPRPQIWAGQGKEPRRQSCRQAQDTRRCRPGDCLPWRYHPSRGGPTAGTCTEPRPSPRSLAPACWGDPRGGGATRGGGSAPPRAILPCPAGPPRPSQPHSGPAVPRVGDPLSPLLREEISSLQLKGEKRDSPSLRGLARLCTPPPPAPQRRDGMSRGPELGGRGRAVALGPGSQKGTAGRGRDHATPMQGQQGAPRGGRAGQSTRSEGAALLHHLACLPGSRAVLTP